MPTEGPILAARVPRQTRARDTRARILAAAEALLRNRRFEDITIGEIVSEANSSVGSFYHLFESKEAIVGPLYARYDERITERSVRLLARARLRHRSLGDRVRWIVRYAVRLYRNERGLLRTVALHARSHAEDVTAEQQDHRATLYDSLASLLLECRHEVAHPDPEGAIRLGLFFVAATCRDKILFGDAPHPRSITINDRNLSAELASALLSYLCAPSILSGARP